MIFPAGRKETKAILDRREFKEPQEVLEPKGRKAHRERREIEEPKVHRGTKVRRGIEASKVMLDFRATRVPKALKVTKAHREIRGLRAHKEVPEERAIKEIRETKGIKVLRVIQAHREDARSRMKVAAILVQLGDTKTAIAVAGLSTWMSNPAGCFQGLISAHLSSAHDLGLCINRSVAISLWQAGDFSA